MINLFVKKKEAYAVFEDEQKGGGPRRVTYTSLINLFVKKEDEKRANAVFEEMQAKGVRPDVVTYNSLINLFVKKEDQKRGYAVFEEMKTKGVRPNVVTYTSLINLFVKKEDQKGAYAVFEDMQAKGVQPDEVTFNSLIDLLVKLDCLEEAKRLFLSKLSIKDMIEEKNSLNLHRFSHGAAYIGLSIFIESHWDNQTPFILITGKGLHSGKLYEMRDFMMKKISEKFAHLSCEIDGDNRGRLFIKKRHVQL